MFKGLKQFVPDFEAERFFDKKQLQVTACSAWHDYESKALRGTKVEVVIIVDGTEYQPTKKGEIISNAFEKVTIKVPQTVSFAVGTPVRLVNPKAVIYGQYQNELSVTCENIIPVTTKNNP